MMLDALSDLARGTAAAVAVGIGLLLGAATIAPSSPAAITSLTCRNGAVVHHGGERWVVQELLPVGWHGRSSVTGRLSHVGDATVFAAEGHVLSVVPYQVPGADCVGWALRGSTPTGAGLEARP